MTPQELRTIRDRLNLRQSDLYRDAQLGAATSDNVQGMIVSKMELGRRPISADVAAKVRKLALDAGVVLA